MIKCNGCGEKVNLKDNYGICYMCGEFIYPEPKNKEFAINAELTKVCEPV